MKNEAAILRKELEHIKKLLRLGGLDKALNLIEQLLEKYPKSHEAWNLSAHIKAQLGLAEASIADRTRAIDLTDKEPHYFYMRGIDLFGQGRHYEAVEDFTMVLELCDYHHSDYYRLGAYFFRADSYVRLKKFDQARSDCLHIADGTRIWTDKQRSKEDIVADCSDTGG